MGCNPAAQSTKPLGRSAVACISGMREIQNTQIDREK
jgi:hypothetical protein